MSTSIVKRAIASIKATAEKRKRDGAARKEEEGILFSGVGTLAGAAGGAIIDTKLSNQHRGRRAARSSGGRDQEVSPQSASRGNGPLARWCGSVSLHRGSRRSKPEQLIANAQLRAAPRAVSSTTSTKPKPLSKVPRTNEPCSIRRRHAARLRRRSKHHALDAARR